MDDFKHLDEKPSDELVGFVRDTFDVVEHESDGFGIELGRLDAEWRSVCASNNVKPQKILIVNDSKMVKIKKSLPAEVSNVMAKLLTRGFSVLPSVGYDVCFVCNSVIFSRDQLVSRGLKWTGCCQKCHDYDPREIDACSMCNDPKGVVGVPGKVNVDGDGSGEKDTYRIDFFCVPCHSRIESKQRTHS